MPEDHRSSPQLPGLARRSLLTAAGAAALLATAGCNPFTATKTTTTVTATAPALPDPIEGLIAITRLHLFRLTAAVAADKQHAALLKVLQQDRADHLAALIKEQQRTSPSAVAPGPTTGTQPVPADVKLIVPTIREDAATAQGRFTDAVSSSSRYRAALFGSIAACLASHRAVLA